MKHDHLAGWIKFLTSPTAPATAMRPVELDGYLTGLIVAPDLIPPSLWIDGIWGDDQPVLDSMDQLQAIIDSVMGHYNAIIDLIDKRGPDHRPMFMDEKGNADPEIIVIWAIAPSLTPIQTLALAPVLTSADHRITARRPSPEGYGVPLVLDLSRDLPVREDQPRIGDRRSRADRPPSQPLGRDHR